MTKTLAKIQTAETTGNEVEIVMRNGHRHIGVVTDTAWTRGVFVLDTGMGNEVLSLNEVVRVM